MHHRAYSLKRVIVFARGAAVAVALAACSDSVTSPICTANVEPGIIVSARSIQTGENITEGAVGVAVDGAFVDSLRPYERAAGGTVSSLAGAFERPGTYDLWIERDGYQPVSLAGVEVNAGTCHVEPTRLSVSMSAF